MKESLHYNIRDILAIPHRALSAKRILSMTFFLCIGVMLYSLFTYLALAVDGEPLKTYWAIYGLLPFALFKINNIFAGLIYAIGIFTLLLSMMLGFFAVSAIEIEQIRGNRFFRISQAIKFSFQRLGQLFFSELAIVLFILFIIVLYAILGLITSIPFIGEWIFALTFIIPGFVVALFTVFIILVLIISLILLPAVTSAEKKKESFNTIIMTFSTIVRQPSRWFSYTVYSVIAAKFASYVYAYFCYRAIQFSIWSVSLTAGDKPESLIKAGLSHLPIKSDIVKETLSVFPGVDWGVSLNKWAYSSSNDAAGYLMAGMLFLIFASIIGYAFSIIATGQARAYTIIRYIKDDYKISDEPPLFEDNSVTSPEKD